MGTVRERPRRRFFLEQWSFGLRLLEPRTDGPHAARQILLAQQPAAEHDVGQGQQLPLRRGVSLYTARRADPPRGNKDPEKRHTSIFTRQGTKPRLGPLAERRVYNEAVGSALVNKRSVQIVGIACFRYVTAGWLILSYDT
jgi:hypothetical protein